ncbi:MAG: sigma-54 dependent transcriptional regulator, partial [Proteobacteria bacterium]|nr:sigma-54 dependent transcriptional regulator [Pseudomonadota bacterium]
MNISRVLIVEDDPTLRMALVDTLEVAGYQVYEAINGKEALLQLMHHDVEAIVSDVQMDVMDGDELLAQVRDRYPSIPILMMTAHASIERAVSAIRDGAVDYLQKPFEASDLVTAVARMTAGSKVGSSAMVAEDPATKSILEVARRVAPSDASIMISGESGTGKEVLAKTIHELSNRADKPFVALNCAAIPENMLEAILFGYEKGAFTGAQTAREGKFEQANGGTLLLDEISEMALELQAKLLRVLQEQEVERLGGKCLIPLDVRVLATTNRRLTDEVASGRFREDLYFRLNVFPMELPPLRARPEDIIPLSL